MLAAKSDELLHRWVVAALDVGAEKLATLREAERMEAAGKIAVVAQHAAHHVDLGVDVEEESVGLVLCNAS
jgi:hypothetical protein